jgi:hypothetical protein
MPQRNRAWLVEYVRQPIAATPRNQRYLALLEPHWDEEQVRSNLAWLRDGGESGEARRLTNWLGYLAFHLHAVQPQGERRATLLKTLREGYRYVADHMTSEGRFVWPNEPDMYWAGSHEHAWRLEPLLLGVLWMGEELGDGREYVEAALRRAAQWLVENPLLQTNNRGAVWCAITTLCGLYFDEPEYLALAHRHAEAILSEVVLQDGECGEHTRQYGGGGPCSNYSYTGWAYVSLYRLLSDDRRLDDRLEKAARWFTLYNTLSGCPIVDGASVRKRLCDPGSFKDVLPMWEHLSRREPFFALAAQKALDKMEHKVRRRLPAPAHQGAGHIVSPFIWAALENSTIEPPAELPDWHRRHTRMYERLNVQYALVSRAAYQTGVTLRGLSDEYCNFPLRGMQTFAWGDELPILLHTDEDNSSLVADGVNTATDDVTIGAHGAEAHLAVDETEEALATLAARHGVLWTLYAYTPVSAVVVCGGVPHELTARWVMNRRFVSEPSLDEAARRVSYGGRRGCLYYRGGDARLLSEKPGANILQVVSAVQNVFAFSDKNFGFEDEVSDETMLIFHDAGGRYRLQLDALLDADGNLSRAGSLLTKLRGAL